MKRDIRKTSGAILAQLRKAHGLSQVQLAKRVKTSPNTVSRWESGIYRMSLENVSDLSQILECDPGVFFKNKIDLQINVRVK